MSYDIDNYYERDEGGRGTEQHLIRAGYGVQSAEINEIQALSRSRLKGIADALFRDGDIISDCQAVVNDLTGAVRMNGGALYLRGAVRGVAPANFVIPVDQTVTIGIRLRQQIVTELEAPDLRDPALGTRNYGEPGAGRLVITSAWGWNGDNQPGDFLGVYTVENGVLLSKEPPPQLDSVTQALARYDRDSAGGNYVIEGLAVSATYDSVAGKVVALVAEGRARVNGYPVEIPRSLRLSYDADADLKTIQAEPHIFTPDGTGKMRVNLDATPLVAIQEVRITAEKTVSLTHGAFSGAKDPLPDTSVLALVEVKQGGVTYVQGTDYKLTAGQVDWSLAGAEPSPGSSYTVKYQYITTTDLVISAQDQTGFTLQGAVTGTQFQVDYSFALPRIDAIALDSDGRVNRIKGVASQYASAAPSIPDTMLRIASLSHNWSGNPTVVRDPVVVLPMDELQGMRSLVFDLFDLVAQERLLNRVSLNDPASKRGVFVDPFTNDNLRDAGITQNLAIIDGELMLPIAADVHAIGTSITAPQLLPYTLETIINQPLKTGSMKVNPYQAFDPMPATMQLAPNVDFWTQLNVVWTSDVTRRFVQGVGNRSTVTTSTGVEVVATTERAAEFLRPIQVRFTLKGFGPGEVLQKLTFDGITVTPENP